MISGYPADCLSSQEVLDKTRVSTRLLDGIEALRSCRIRRARKDEELCGNGWMVVNLVLLVASSLSARSAILAQALQSPR